MRTLIILALFALLGASVWFAGAAWERLGGGLMGLVFYSSRHGYDDDENRFDKTK